MLKNIVKKAVSAAVAAAMLCAAGVTAPAADPDEITARSDKLTVDVSKQRGEIIHGAAGFLYGIADEEVPTSNTVVPLKPKVMCLGTMLLTEHPYGDAEYTAEQFLEDGGEQVMMYMSNYYGYALGVTADYKQYAKVMKERTVPHIVEWKRKWKEEHGVPGNAKDNLGERIDIDKALIYLPINEGTPRNGTDDFGIAWLEYYRAIKEVDPDATIGGTNDYAYNAAFGAHPTEDRAYNLSDFIPFCIENDCLPDVFTWHELSEDCLANISAHTADFKERWEKAWSDAIADGDTDKTEVPEVPQIVINEYAPMDDCGVPGRLVNWIARFEDSGLYACLPFWHQANSLNDLASDANEGSGSWWTYKWYGDMSGTLLDVKSTTAYNELYGLATLDENKRNLKVLLGGQDGSAAVQIENLDESETFKDADKVHIKVESSDYAGMIGTQYEPDTVLEGDFDVNGDGSVMFAIDNMKFSGSFCVTVTEAEDGADTSVRCTAPYIGYYEAERAAARNGAEICAKSAGGNHWGAASYLSDDSFVYMRTAGSTLEYTLDIPYDGRYELNFIYGSGEGTTRWDPEGSLSKNLEQELSIDGAAGEALTMNNTLLSNTTGAKRVFKDLTAGEHTVTLVSKENGELLHDLLVVKYKGVYGKEIVFDKIYEAEAADFNTLLGNTETTVSTRTGEGASGGYVEGLSMVGVGDGGGIRWSPVVRESGLYNVTLRYKSDSAAAANIYIGNTACATDRKTASIALPASADWSEAAATVYLEKGINIIDIDTDAEIKLDYMRLTDTGGAADGSSVTIAARDAIPAGQEAMFTLVPSGGAASGSYVEGMSGADTARAEADGIRLVTAKLEQIDENLTKKNSAAGDPEPYGTIGDGDESNDVIRLTTRVTNTGDTERTIVLKAVMRNNEYAVVSDPNKTCTDEELILSRAETTVTLGAGETREIEQGLDPTALKKSADFTEPEPGSDYGGPFRITSDKLVHTITMSAENEDGTSIIGKLDATYASETSAKDTPGQYLELKYNAPAEGDYKLRVFHSNDELCGEHPYNTKVIDRYMNISVTDKDGNETSDERYFFINTYSRDTFKEKTITLHLREGENTLRMYNNDTVSRWYGGDVAIPSQRRQKNYAPNLDKFVITPAALNAPVAADMPDAPKELRALKNSAADGYEDEYIINAGFGSGNTDGWTADGAVGTGRGAADSYDGFYALVSGGGTLGQTVNTAELSGDYFVSLYSKGTADASGRVYLTVKNGGDSVKKAVNLSDSYEPTVIKLTLSGEDIEIGVDASGLTSGGVYVDSFRLKAASSRKNVNAGCEYFVDCGDHFPETIAAGERYGKRNSVTDKLYGVDETTGYKWGVYTTEEDYAVTGWSPSKGIWTKYTWPNQWSRAESDDALPKTETYRGTWGTQVDDNGYTDSTRYVRYKFELDPGEYKLRLGLEAMWWQGGPYTIKINGEEIGTAQLFSEDSWATTVHGEFKYSFTVPESEDSVLLSVESYGSGNTDATRGGNIWLNYIYINDPDAADDPSTEIFDEDSFKLALNTGGDYTLSEDIEVANSGTAGANTTGTVDGKGGTITKGFGKNGDAIIYHNDSSDWTYENVTIDGNKTAITNTDACIWLMSGATTFKNAAIRNFKTTASERMAITNVGGTLTLDNAEFDGNENIGDNSEVFGGYADVYLADWSGNSRLVLKGDTKVKVYYTAGAIDISELGGKSEVSIRAANDTLYETLKGLTSSGAVTAVYDDANKTVSFVESAAPVVTDRPTDEPEKAAALDAAKTETGVEARISNLKEDAELYAAFYGVNGELLSINMRSAAPGAEITESFDIAPAASTARIFLWKKGLMEPLTPAKGVAVGAAVKVYTREASDEYSSYLANSVHIAVSADGEEYTPLNNNYGILFPEAGISEKNSIISYGARDPRIFKTAGGEYCIAAVLTANNNENEYNDADGKLVVWYSADLVNFTEPEVADADSALGEYIAGADASDAVAVSADFCREVMDKYSAPECVEVTVPETVTAAGEEDINEVKAVVKYSDGSEHESAVDWDMSGVDFTKPGSYTISGTVKRSSVSFPADGYDTAWGDPVILCRDNMYYFIATDDANVYGSESGNRYGQTFKPGFPERQCSLIVRRAKTVAELFTDKAEWVSLIELSEEPDDGKLVSTIWAPEFHVIGDDVYLFFTANDHWDEWPPGSGTMVRAFDPKSHVMKLKAGGNIMNPNDWEEPRVCVKADGVTPIGRDVSQVADGSSGITLDMNYFEAGGRSYAAWSYRTYSPADSGSMIMLAEVDRDKPWQLKSDPVLLSRPVYGWENINGTDNNEGPYALVRDGKVYITYSGGNADTDTYALGLLTADESANLLDPASWTKAQRPILSSYSIEGEYGPGHNSFFEDENGDIYIAYHAHAGLGYSSRLVGIRRVHFGADGNAVFDMSMERDLGDDLKTVTLNAAVE